MPRAPLPPRAARLRRVVLLRRYENQVAVVAEREIKKAREQLVALLLRKDPGAVSPGRIPRRVEAIAREADEILREAYANVNAKVRAELYGLSKVTASSTEAEVRRAVAEVGVDLTSFNLPTADKLRAIVTTDPVQGAVMSEWWKQQRLTTRNAFRQQIQLGLVRGETISDLVVRIRGVATGRGFYTGGIMQASTRQASALVRTAVNEIANKAALLTYGENSRVVQGFEFVATLDERTTEICADSDGRVYALDDPAARIPPLHWNCRSTTIPRLNYKELGVKAPAREARETYPAWFARQDSEVQARILGPARAELVASGSVSFSDLVRQDGSRATLDELSRG